MVALKKSAVIYHYLYFSCTSAAAAPRLFFPKSFTPLRAENLPFDEIDIVYLLNFVGPPGFVNQLSLEVGKRP
ncbi:hypothetical protein CASFOL_012339 [Castilleja foliolosa]|uniref:Uncharacterized protein n=1 Tax=Castilleja foliolosa TaxID=1961234 RepID=A0ABD3DRZ5_9LAMI